MNERHIPHPIPRWCPSWLNVALAGQIIVGAFGLGVLAILSGVVWALFP